MRAAFATCGSFLPYSQSHQDDCCTPTASAQALCERPTASRHDLNREAPVSTVSMRVTIAKVIEHVNPSPVPHLRDSDAGVGYGRRMQGKALDAAMNDAARSFTKSVIATKYSGVVSRAAKAFGMSQAMLSEFLAGKRGAGMKMLGRIAVHEHVPVDQIIGLSAPSEPVVERSEMPEELAELLTAERARGREWPRDIIDAALTIRHYQGERMSHEDWRSFLNELELTARRPPKLPPPPSHVPSEEEEALERAERMAALQRRREAKE